MGLELKSEMTSDEEARLRQAWGEPISISEIGRRFNCPWKTVVRRAEQLGLPEREFKAVGSVPNGHKAEEAVRRLDARAAVFANIINVVTPISSLICDTIHNCSWVVEMGKPALYCDAPVKRGKSYCAEHCETVFREAFGWEDSVLKGALKYAG